MAPTIKAIKISCTNQAHTIIDLDARGLHAATSWTRIPLTRKLGFSLKYATGEKLEDLNIDYPIDSSDNVLTPNTFMNFLTVNYDRLSPNFGKSPKELMGNIILARCDGKDLCFEHLITIEKGLKEIKSTMQKAKFRSDREKRTAVDAMVSAKYFAEWFDLLRSESLGRREVYWREVENIFR